MPITSPVERISGPSTASASGNRLNGSTASLTEMCPPVTGGRSSPSASSSASVAPHMTRAAIFTSGTPVALATKGTVRLARGLASITKTWAASARSSMRVTANCTLISPRTSRASAMRRVYSSITAMVPALSPSGGIMQAESPECTPASSTCSMTAPMTVRPV